MYLGPPNLRLAWFVRGLEANGPAGDLNTEQLEPVAVQPVELIDQQMGDHRPLDEPSEMHVIAWKEPKTADNVPPLGSDQDLVAEH